MFKLIYTNSRGQSIEFFGRPWRLLNVTGLGDVNNAIQISNKVYLDSELESRTLDITLKIEGENSLDVSDKRSHLTSVVNPLLGLGTLLYINGDKKRVIKVVAESLPSFPGDKSRTRRSQIAHISFIAPKPHWLNAVSENVKLQDFVAGFHFPFHFPVSFAIRGDKRTLHNGGDVPAPVKVTFRGNTVNPTVRNITTGDFIKVNYEIPDGYTFVVDTENKTVKMYDSTGTSTNMFRYLDNESTFFDLVLGDNDISFATDGGEPEVYIEFTERYGAV